MSERPSRYRRRRYFSWIGLLLGLALGVGAGLLYTWVVNPVEETNIAPWQLNQHDKDEYMVAIIQRFAHDGDLNSAITSLLGLQIPGQPTDPIQGLAAATCDLASTGYVNSSAGLRAIRTVMSFYQAQGRHGCADQMIQADIQATPIIEVNVPTPTLAPPATKTPTPEGRARPTPTPVIPFVPTSPPQTDYQLVDARTFCDPQLSGLIEVFVQDYNGDGIAGQEIRVRWVNGQDTFFTGLKPERGPGYSDFQMESGNSYTVEMPGRSDPSQQPLVANPCTTDNGSTAVTSYRIVFRPVG